jgi:hypothetical protein
LSTAMRKFIKRVKSCSKNCRIIYKMFVMGSTPKIISLTFCTTPKAH